MQITIKPDPELDSALQVSLTGKLHTYNADGFWEQVNAQINSERCSLILDFTHLSLITSAGIGTLIRLYGRVSPLGGRLSIFGCNPNVHKVIRVVGLQDMLGLTDTLDDARSLLRARHQSPEQS